MTFIPNDKIDEIRERADIVQIISDYVNLKKAGRNHKGLCPFHSEKTPSFTVSEEKQIFYCFGCGAGGNVITFLMKHENMSFPETVKHLAKRYGIEIKEVRGQESGARSQKEGMFAINETSCEFFIKNLSQDLRGAQNAMDYLKKRGLTEDIIKEFKIGYAPDSWDSLLNFLRYKKLPMDMAEKLGLIIKKQSQAPSPKPQVPRYYDRFRNRLVFPILDIQGRVLGFGGRTLGKDDAKYINSPESEIFKKGEVFYGISHAKGFGAKAGYLLVVEGYFDLIALHQFGFKNSVATMGTALTQEHLRKMRNYTGEVYALFDGDEAGARAAIRSIPLFLDEGTKARIVLIPKGIDPDELLRKHGRHGLERSIKEAQPFMDFLLDETKKRFDTTSSGGKIGFIEEVGGYIAKIKNQVERNFYIEKIAHLIQVGRDVVASAIKEGQGAGRSPIGEPIRRMGRDGRGQGARGIPSCKEVISAKTTGTRLAEETMLKILLVYPNLYNNRISDMVRLFKDDMLKRIGEFLIEALQSKSLNIQPQALIDKISDDSVKNWLIKTSVSDNEEIKEEPEKILDDCCKKVIASGSKKERDDLLNRIHEADKSGNRLLMEKTAKLFIEKKKRP